MFQHILNVLNLDNPGFQWLLAFLTIASTVVGVALCLFVVLMLIVVLCRCRMSPMLLCIPSSLF